MTAAVAMLRPVDAGIPTEGNRAFGVQRSAEHTHQGIDMVARKGTPVRAVRGGIVTHASNGLAQGFSGYGRHVVIRVGSKGPWLLYAHLDHASVRPGDTVAQGQQIGTVGNTCFNREDPSHLCGGKAGAGYHLHFEVSPRRYPQPSEAPRLDPVAFLSSGTHETPPAVASRAPQWALPPFVLGAALWLLTSARRRQA